MSAESDSTQSAPLVRALVFITSWLCVLSGLYHISAVYLRPLPGEMHPNMHMLLAYSILLIGGAGAMPQIYGDKIRKLKFLPVLYLLSLIPAVIFYYFVYEMGEGWSDASVWWVYALPFAIWIAMMVVEKSWLALLLWVLGFVPAPILFWYWDSLPESTHDPTFWWLLITCSAIPVMWTLFAVFFRPVEGVKKAGVFLAVFFVALILIGWRVSIWAGQSDDVRSVLSLWPVVVFAFPLFWAKRRIKEVFEEYPAHPFPAGFTIGLNAGMLFFVATACLYLFYYHEEMVDRPGAPTIGDARVGFVMLVVALELTRRCFGPPLPTLAVIAFTYGIWGNLFAAPFGHGGHTWIELQAKLSTDFIGGVLGFLVVISATFIIMFLILGAFLHESGAGRFFVNFALGLFGKMRAGAGLAAVGSSALMGTVSGSASGNVVTTGTFTIPLMKRIGLSPHIAGAAEAAASSGGQIMPPVMGAGAFIMSELIEVPYFHLIGYATIPAILYFTIVGINIHFAAGALNIQPLPASEIPSWKEELKNGWFYLVPLAFLVYFLFEGRTPVFAGVMSVFIMVGIWFYRNVTEFLGTLRQGDKTIADDVFVFVPVTFWVFVFFLFALLSIFELGFGLSLGIYGEPTWSGSLLAALALGVIGFVLMSIFNRIFSWVGEFWREIERNWLAIFPLTLLGFWGVLGWTSGVAGLAIVLVLLCAWSIFRGNGAQPTTTIPWYFAFIWGGAYFVQKGLYTLVPAIADFGEWFVPFGFIYDGLIFFGLAVIVQRVIYSTGSQESEANENTPSVKQVLAVSCNPFTYLQRAKNTGETGPSVQAAQSASNWISSIRDALRVGGRQGAEFAVTLATIEVVVQVLTITGVGNKFAFMIEALAQDICLFGAAAGGGCAYYIGLDGFFVALLLTAVCCAILGMGMPTTAAYVLLAILGGPVLIKLVGPELTHIYGVEWVKEFVASKGDRVAAHMFIFYFAILSAITPPVAIASLVGAKLAGAPYFKTSMMSLRFAIVGFIVPFLFMFDPALLTFAHPLRVALSATITLLGFIAFSAGAQGWLLERLHTYERFLLFVCFVTFILFVIFFSVTMLVTGLICGGIPLIRQIKDYNKPLTQT